MPERWYCLTVNGQPWSARHGSLEEAQSAVAATWESAIDRSAPFDAVIDEWVAPDWMPSSDGDTGRVDGSSPRSWQFDGVTGQWRERFAGGRD